ncbi:6380_t:CDS:2 [Cetraspora pellucida]|uniref:6380_t:CDS:1 n=1 Tax=Cetraspora pellucida TaxID=1433469 RepID=A0A9N8WKC9_9GLOM|nr:6380_t:CDS:2 [Cetraspora pellucida]
MMVNDSLEYYQNKESIISKNKKSYKCKNPSFTREYFEKTVNSTGEEVRICKVQDENRKKCNQEYKNVGSSTGNLIAHLRDVHGIVLQDDIEVLLKWMILTNQSLSTITNNTYREKMSEFDPAFVVPSKKKIRTMIVKSYKYNRENLQNLVNIAESVSLTMDFWSSKAKHEYLGITATWVTSDFEIKDNLKNHIILVTTDSGANMVSTFSLLNQKDGCCIQDVPTHWNSIYYAWDRLYFIKDAITQLQTDLYISIDQEIKKDGSKLKRILLSDEDWVIPKVKEIIFDLASETPPSNDLFFDEDTIFELEDAEIQHIDYDDDEIVSNITKRRISIKNPLNMTGILEKIKKNIYDAMIYYWNVLNEVSLMMALLDPRYKSLDFLENNTEKQQVIQKLPLETENPLSWWKVNSSKFTKLFKIAQKYLGIPATSVSCERLFSHASNLISAKRTSLDPALVGQMLFLKRNINTISIFAPE